MRNDIENCPFVPDCLRPNDRVTLIVNFSKGDDKPSQQSSTIFFFSRSNCNKHVLRIFFHEHVKKKKKKKEDKIAENRENRSVNAIRTRARLTRDYKVVCFRSFRYNAHDLSKRETKVD